MLKFLKTNRFVIILTIILLVSFLIRIWQLGRIGELIFDEVYFVNFARNYLSGISFFDIHPPLGKLLIALPIKFFGDASFTWRIAPAIFGTLLILVGYLTGKEISNRTTGIFVALIMALDGMLLVYSRVGLIDMFLVFFVLLSFYLFLKFAHTKKLVFLILAGIALGLCASIKYVGALTLLSFVFIIIAEKIPLRKNMIKFIIFLGVVPLAIYITFFLFNLSPNRTFFQELLLWHKQSFNYNIYLTDDHPYASKWWSWFLLLRPIWLFFKDIDGRFVGIDGIGNPLAWWSFVAVIPLFIWGAWKGDKNNLIILGSFFIFWFFWAFFKRVLFLYHALPSFTFLVLGTALLLEKLLKIPYGKYYVITYFILLFCLFLFFLPIWLGLPIETNSFYHRIWLRGWI